MDLKMSTKLFILSLVVSCVLAQNETTTEEPPVTTVVTDQDVTTVTDEESVTTEFLPTLSPNVATKLVPFINKNMQEALKQNEESANEVKDDRFKRRQKNTVNKKVTSNLAPVKNSTAAEILLNKVKSKSRARTYHDPEFKSKKLVRIRPRVKSLTELKSETQTENSPIIETNALLLDNASAAPQGAQPYDWSRRKVLNPRISNFRNRFRNYNKPTAEPESQDESTEVHVVTSISDEHETPTESPTTTTTTTTVKPVVSTPGSSYQYVSFGTLEPATTEGVLELEKLFLNEKLDVDEADKKKRKVESRPAPVQVDSQIKVLGPSQALPTSYVAPGLRSEQVKDFIGKDAINTDDYDYTSEENVPFLDNLTEDLDSLIISSVEEALQVSIPLDSTLRTRDVKKPKRNPNGKGQVRLIFTYLHGLLG